ncbi:hypothetical protein HOP50_03g21040 [Chloropicon primus]|uniref:Uncharacterized protein n=2 Tax=Chloropicon primus TaxID=1764295 RepID=A0A5B8MGK0_9CHLO|nr:hypothetical protein A3770_03p21040 [Chloropicon primus]UPQ98798.1 hypothetical protein HOP50_03g21040 [Chloropicon primus]|eukprot:QDZ19586.1 hypothetical protein A3770_03p21040 [Chloropicon primus]
MDIQTLRDQAKEARQKAELQFLTMAAHGDSLKKQQELQKDLLPKKSTYRLGGAGDQSPGGRGLEMRRLQAEQMEQKVRDMKRSLASRTWYDGSTLRPEEESKLSVMEEKSKADPLEEVFKFAKHAPPPPKESLMEAVQSKQKEEGTKAPAATKLASAIGSTRPKIPELSTFELPTTSEPKTLQPDEPSMKLFSKPPPSFQKVSPLFPMDDEDGDGDGYESWVKDTAPPFGYPEMFPPPPPPLFTSSRKARQEGGAVEAEAGRSKHKRRSKHKSARRSRKESHHNKEAKEGAPKVKDEPPQKTEVEEGASEGDKENKKQESDALKDVSEHSKRVASVHELEKERDALRQDIALLAAAVQNRNQMPAHPTAPVIVQYPMPQQAQPQAPPAPPPQEPRPKAEGTPSEIANSLADARRSDSTNDDLVRMFNSAFNSGDIELKKYLQHDVLRLRKRNEFLESERVDLLTMKAEFKRISADFVSAKASLEALRSENNKMREENGRLQGLNDILTEEVKRGGSGEANNEGSLEAELSSLRVMNHKLKLANKELLEEQKNHGAVESQLLEKIESLETTKMGSPVRKLESQIAALQSENLEKEEELAELQERAAQIDRLREENASLELQLIELKMKTVQEIPLNAKLQDAAEELGKMKAENTSLAEQVKSLTALNDEVNSSKKLLESKCAMYEKVLQERNLLTSGITMYDPTGNLMEKNKKEMKSAVKDYIASEYDLPQLEGSGPDSIIEGSGADLAPVSPSQSPHGKLVLQTGKENIQTYLVKASTRRDFMRMGKNEAAKGILSGNDDLEIEFSDLVFKRDESGVLKKFILVITKKCIYLLTCDQYRCEWSCNYADLFRMGWDSQILEDLTFKAAKAVDVCIQSPRRDIVIGTILTLLEGNQGNFQVKKDLSSFSLLRSV